MGRGLTSKPCHAAHARARRLSVSGAGLGGRTLELSLDDLQGGAAGPIVRRQATLQVRRERGLPLRSLRWGAALPNHRAVLRTHLLLTPCAPNLDWTAQCAGNRRNEMAALKLVEGRAPWNHGEPRTACSPPAAAQR